MWDLVNKYISANKPILLLSILKNNKNCLLYIRYCVEHDLFWPLKQLWQLDTCIIHLSLILPWSKPLSFLIDFCCSLLTYLPDSILTLQQFILNTINTMILSKLKANHPHFSLHTHPYQNLHWLPISSPNNSFICLLKPHRFSTQTYIVNHLIMWILQSKKTR